MFQLIVLNLHQTNFFFFFYLFLKPTFFYFKLKNFFPGNNFFQDNKGEGSKHSYSSLDGTKVSQQSAPHIPSVCPDSAVEETVEFRTLSSK